MTWLRSCPAFLRAGLPGTPISLLVRNTDQRSRDYSEHRRLLPSRPRGLTGFDAKYGFRDYRGGGRSSGRETIGRVAAGSHRLLCCCGSWASPSAPTPAPSAPCPLKLLTKNEIREQSPEHAGRGGCRKGRRLAGGVHVPKRILPAASSNAWCTACPPGPGDPVFEKLDANLAKASHVHRRCKGRGNR